MKKIYLISALLFAMPLFAKTPNLNHVYGGIMLSYANAQTNPSHPEQHFSPSARGSRTHIFAGMGSLLNQIFFIGSEFYVDLGDIHVKRDGVSNDRTYHQDLAYRADYGIKFRLGFVTPYHYVLYTLAGYNRGCFRDDLLVLGDPDKQHVGIWRNGYLYGAGIEVPLKHHLFLRLEVNKTRYKHFHTHFHHINLTEHPKATAASAGLSIAYYL